MKHNFLKFSKNIGLYGMAMLIGFSMFTSNCGGDDPEEEEEIDTTEVSDLDMVFNSFSPDTGSFGGEITVYGENFDGDVEVTINGIDQEEISVNDDGTELVFSLASKTYSGIVVLSRDGEDDIESDDELSYNLTYDVEDFNATKGGADIIVLGDGSYYLTYNGGLIMLNSSHEVVDTLVIKDYVIDPNGLFLADDGTLYIADGSGQILRYASGAAAVDTLVKDVSSLNGTSFNGITGDNEGYIYVTNKTGYQVVKIEVDNPANITEIINTTDDSTIGITLEGDTLYVSTYYGAIKASKNASSTDGFEYVVEKDSGYSFEKSDISVHPSGNVFITDADGNNGGFYKISANNAITKEMEFYNRGIFIDPNGDIFLTEGTVTKKLIVY